MRDAAMGPFELMDRIVNGRPKPEPRVIRVRLTPEQIRKIEAGAVLDFRAGRTTVMVMHADPARTGRAARAAEPCVPRKGGGKRR